MLTGCGVISEATNSAATPNVDYDVIEFPLHFHANWIVVYSSL